METKPNCFDWFNFENYEDVKDFTLHDWYDAIHYRRINFLLLRNPPTAFSFSPEEYERRCEAALQYWRDVRENGARKGRANFLNHTASDDSTDPGKVQDIPSIKDVTTRDLIENIFDPGLFEPMWHDYQKFLEALDWKYDAAEEEKRQAGEKAIADYVNKYEVPWADGWSDLGIVEVDLNAPDEQIKEDFSYPFTPQGACGSQGPHAEVLTGSNG